MLKLDAIHYSYGEVEALRGVNLNVPKNAILGLMGRNGVGKTTLLQSIMGLLPARGGMQLGDMDLAGLGPHRRSVAGIGFVPQGRQIFPRLTVEENLRVALAANPEKAAKIPDFIFDEFPVLAEMRKRQGGNLSGGQQQQLAIGRALVTDPSLLVLDEPTEGIQPNIIEQIGDLLQRLVTSHNLTVLVVEQYVEWIRNIGTHFAIMNRGQVVTDGPVDGLSDAIVKEYLSV